MDTIIDKERNYRSPEKYLSDKNVAEILSVSPGWVRKQRHLRKYKEEHILAVDAVYIGSSPRYKSSEINKWLSDIQASKVNTEHSKGGF